MRSDQWRQLHRLRGHLAVARIRQQLPRQVGGPFAGLHHVLQQRVGRMRFRHGISRKAGAAHDAHQQIVEIVRHAAGQQTDAVQLLLLKQRVLRILLLGHVGRGKQPRRRARRVGGQYGRNQMPAILPVGAQETALCLQRAARLRRRRPPFLNCRAILGMHTLHPGARRRRPAAHKTPPPVIAESDLAALVRPPDQLRNRLHQNAIFQPRQRFPLHRLFQIPVALFQRGPLLVDLPLHPEFLDRAADNLLQRFGRRRILARVVRHARFHRLYGYPFVSQRREHYYGASFLHPVQGPNYIQSVPVRQPVVQQNAIREQRDASLYALAAGCGLVHRYVPARRGVQRLFQDSPVSSIIVDD